MRVAGIDDEITNGKRGSNEKGQGREMLKEFCDKGRWVAWLDRKQRLRRRLSVCPGSGDANNGALAGK